MEPLKLSVLLPENEIKFLQNNNIIQSVNAADCANSNANFSRALYWMANCDCAIVTAWRSGRTRKTNDDNNQILQLALRKYGYGVSKIRGCYTEVGKPTSHENSFLVFCHNGQSDLFINKIYELSARFEQDCFLYKTAGDDMAYLIGTNQDFCTKYGNKVPAGELHFASMPNENYSRIGSGKICFQ